MDANENAAMLARSVVEETDTLVRLHKGQDYPGGILPRQGGEQERKVRIGASSAVHGSVVGGEVTIDDAENISLSSGIQAPGTEIQGSVNSIGNITIGRGIWIQGGVIAQGDVEISSEVIDGEEPGHVLIEGAVAGRNVTIGEGVVILGPVIATEKCTIGKNSTIRDIVDANKLTVEDGVLLGGLHVDGELTLGQFITIAASQIAIPVNSDLISASGPVRSPYPGCNNCQYQSYFEGDSSIPRKLACHFHAKRANGMVVAGQCDEWSPFPLTNPENHLIFENYNVVSNIPRDAVNLQMYADETTIWERGGE